jgi:hypothetical protein
LGATAIESWLVSFSFSAALEGSAGKNNTRLEINFTQKQNNGNFRGFIGSSASSYLMVGQLSLINWQELIPQRQRQHRQALESALPKTGTPQVSSACCGGQEPSGIWTFNSTSVIGGKNFSQCRPRSPGRAKMSAAGNRLAEHTPTMSLTKLIC